MSFTQFQSIPPQSFLKEIQDRAIRNIYSNITFIYADLKNAENENINKIANKLTNYKFLTFEISMTPSIKEKCNINQNIDNSLNQILIAKFCSENYYYIIENVTQEMILQIINILKKNNIKLINFSDQKILPSLKLEKEDLEANEEVKSFLQHYQSIINTNKFIKNTLKILSGYLIRRFYCPSHFFSNPNFFNFDKNPDNSFENYFKQNLNYILSIQKFSDSDISNFINFLYQSSVQSIENKNFDFQCQYQKYKFSTHDFIKLRNIRLTNELHIYLAFHIESSYIFAIKLFNQDLMEMRTNHETQFCEKFSHRCFTRFYGYLYNNGKEIGFVYEFMSNGTLNDFIKTANKTLINIALFRIFRGINFLHSNSLIHRDIKPDNILIDHNFLPYINDYETIKSIGDENSSENTNDIGSNIYGSPEQHQGTYVSFPTDIYSFGHIVNFLFKDDNLDEESIFIKDIYNSCTKDDYSKRCKSDYIINKIIDEFNQMNDFQYLSQQQNITVIEYFYLNLCYISNQKNIENGICKYIFNILDYNFKLLGKKIDSVFNIKHIQYALMLIFIIYNLNSNNSDIYFKLYFYLMLDDADLNIDFNNDNDLMKILEQKAEQNNFNAQVFLGSFYYNDAKNEKAKKYIELAAKNTNQMSNEILHFINEGVKIDEIISIGIQSIQNYSLNGINVFYEKGARLYLSYPYDAFKYFTLAVKQNYPPAFYCIGFCYMYGIGTEQDFKIAKYFFDKSVKNGDVRAFFMLGEIYGKGLGIKQNYNEAIKYYDLAAQNGNLEAYLYLGCYYKNGYGVKQDYKKAIEYYKMLPNDSYALFQLGFFYFHGIGCNQNYANAKKYLLLSAKQNNPIALFNLGIMYKDYYDEPQDILKSIYYLELSAKQNYSFAYTELGFIYFSGKYSVGVDYSKARKYFELAAKQNNSMGFYFLGLYYFYGISVQKNILKAKEYFEKSANFNNKFAMNALGHIYLTCKKEIKVEYNYLKAIEYLEMSKTFESNFYLGCIYSSIIHKNIQKAIQYLQKCYETLEESIIIDGFDLLVIRHQVFNIYRYRSSNDLGLIFFLNLKDTENSLKYLKESAFHEYPYGQNNYGLFLYYFGNDKNNAQYYFEKASKNNFALAFYNLAFINEKNKNVERSISFYINASKYENEPLYFHRKYHFDIGLEFSKFFIISSVNLKLTNYYWSKSEFEKSKEYFIKAYSSNLLLYPFQFRFQKSQIKYSFLYLKLFFFGNILVYYDYQFQVEIFQKEIEEEQKLYNEFFGKKQNFKTEKDEELFNKTDKYKFMKNDLQKDQIFEDPGKLFDFIHENKELHSIFIAEINDIIETYEKIFYEPPYPILFGRIDFKQIDQEVDENKIHSREIDDSFYEGFGF